MRAPTGLTFTLGVLACLSGGCQGDPNGPQEVKGVVTFKGKPLDQGSIQFEPEPGQAPSAGGSGIADGKFHIRPERGLKPGKYRVMISSGEVKEKARDPLPGESGPPAKERIPAAFNVSTTLRAEVKAGVPTEFTYAIP